MGGIRVLLADDHADFLAVAVRLLEAEFEVVRTFGDGESLLREAAGLRPDLIVLDVAMPGVNGIETARRLKAAGGAAVVFLTVHADPDYVQEALAAGGLGYVVKCRLASDLIPALKEALAGPFVHFAPNPLGEQRRGCGLGPRRRGAASVVAPGRFAS